jgi:hypothetical protein
MMQLRSALILSFIAVFIAAFCTTAAGQQRRDYMTDEEIELVRDAQDIDLRIDVLARMIDRRFAVLKVDVGPAIRTKDSDKWGATPRGERIQLLDDIKRLLEKAIDDIDNVAAHPVDYAADKNRSEKQKKKDMQRFPNAVRALAAAAGRYAPALRTLLDRSTDEKEKGIIIASLEYCDQIVEAATRLPAEPAKN